MMNNITGLLRLGEQDEEPNARGSGRGEVEVPAEHELKIVIGGEGDKRVEGGVRELILEGKGRFNGENCEEMRNEGGEGVDGGWVDGDYAGFAAQIGEGLGAGAWGYMAAVAAHQTELRGGGGDGGLWRGLWVHLGFEIGGAYGKILKM